MYMVEDNDNLRGIYTTTIEVNPSLVPRWPGYEAKVNLHQIVHGDREPCWPEQSIAHMVIAIYSAVLLSFYAYSTQL